MNHVVTVSLGMVLVLVVSSACSSSGGTGGGGGGNAQSSASTNSSTTSTTTNVASTGSATACDVTDTQDEVHYCQDFSALGATTAQADCTTLAGNLVGACSTANTLGTCATADAGVSVTTVYYSDFSFLTSAAQWKCSSAGGSWTTSN
jgi:hypothetical protein